MNKKIKTEIAIGIILLVAIVTGGAIWLSGKKQAQYEPPCCKPMVGDNAAIKNQTGAGVNSAGINQSEPSQKNETADWQTYRNEKYGFEFQYPKDWKINEDAENNEITFQSPAVMKWEAENKINCANKTNCNSEMPAYDLDLKYLPKDKFYKELGNDSTNEVNVSVNGINYVEYSIFGSMVASDNYRTEKNNKIYNFEIIGEGGISKQILSTFKFIN